MLSFDNSRYVQYPRGKERGPDVWWSRGKHASFSDLKTLRGSTAGDWYDAPGEVAKPRGYSLMDVGTLEQPSSVALWITYKNRRGPQRISSVYSKLKYRLWDAAGNALRDVPIVTKADIILAQSVLKMDETTGQLDEKTLQQAAAVLPARRVWTTRKITQAEVEELKADHEIDVSPLL